MQHLTQGLPTFIETILDNSFMECICSLYVTRLTSDLLVYRIMIIPTHFILVWYRAQDLYWLTSIYDMGDLWFTGSWWSVLQIKQLTLQTGDHTLKSWLYSILHLSGRGHIIHTDYTAFVTPGTGSLHRSW